MFGSRRDIGMCLEIFPSISAGRIVHWHLVRRKQGCLCSISYKAQDTPARKTFEQALTGAFMSAVIKDLRPSALPFVASLIRHYTMVAVAQQCGE